MKIYDWRGKYLSTTEHAEYRPPCGQVRVGDRLYYNAWVPSGKVLHQVSCLLCFDSGFVTDDEGEPTEEACDCWRGAAW